MDALRFGAESDSGIEIVGPASMAMLTVSCGEWGELPQATVKSKKRKSLNREDAKSAKKF